MKTGAVLGFARAAGKLRMGRIAVERAIKSGRAQLLLLAEDAAPATKREFLSLAEAFEVPVMSEVTMDGLGQALGASPLAVVCVTDSHFAKELQASRG